MCQEPLPGVRTQQLPRRRDLGCITWSSPSLLQMTSQRSTHLSTCLCSPEKFKFLQPQLSEHKLSAPSLSASLLSQGHCWIPEQETNSVTSDSIPLNLVFPLPLQVLNSSAIYQTWTITIHLMQKNRHETSSQHGKMETSFRMVSQCSAAWVHVRLFVTPWTVQPARVFCPWDSPGKNIRVGGHTLLQGIFPT